MGNYNKVAYTIVNNPYLHFALALSENFRGLHDDYEFRIYLLDKHINAEFKLTDGVKIIEVNSNLIPDLNQRAFYYDITELSTSIKPNIMLDLLNKDYEVVSYIDPDIKFYQRMTEVEDALVEHNFVITPHAMTPVYDGKRPDDLNFLRTGAYNLGFIAVKASEEAERFAQWWMERLKFNGFSAYSAGTFTDQKWIDLLPSYFNGVKILKHPGYNIAYWNLHERNIHGKLSSPEVNDDMVVFYHFSGIKIYEEGISRYQTRFIDYPSPTLEDMFREYRSECRKIDKMIDSKMHKYSRLKDGGIPLISTRMLFLHSIIEGNTIDRDLFSLSNKEIRNIIAENNSTGRDIYYIDPRIEALGSKTRKIPSIIRKMAIYLMTTPQADKIYDKLNNSFNKINISYIIFRLIR